MTQQEETVLIIGAGIFGTSTAYHLSHSHADPSKITVVDRHPSPPNQAASTDINKIIRADYSSPFYCDLAYEALRAWAEWPELRSFYHRTGWVMLDERESDLALRIRKVFRERGHDPTEDVGLDRLEERWGGVMKGTVTDGFGDAYWNPEAGWCDAAAATASLMKAAEERGVKYVAGEVKDLELGDGRVKGVRLANGEILTADKIVLATGAWTSSFLSPIEDMLDLPESDRVERQAQAACVAAAHYKMSTSQMEQLSKMPVVVYGEHGEVIPPPPNSQLLKFTNGKSLVNVITTSSGRKISAPPDRDQHIVPQQLQHETEAAMMSSVMPTFTKGLTAEYWRLCWDARTPTQDWLLCSHPHAQLSNLYLAVGGSFHSYKFLPNAGKYMVNVLNGKGNGPAGDQAWGWKNADAKWRGAHEATAPRRDLKDLEQELSNGH